MKCLWIIRWKLDILWWRISPQGRKQPRRSFCCTHAPKCAGEHVWREWCTWIWQKLSQLLGRSTRTRDLGEGLRSVPQARISRIQPSGRVLGLRRFPHQIDLQGRTCWGTGELGLIFCMSYPTAGTSVLRPYLCFRKKEDKNQRCDLRVLLRLISVRHCSGWKEWMPGSDLCYLK